MDTNCKQAELWISIRVDGERLEEGDARRLEEHLEGCADCRGIFDLESRRSTLLGSVLGDRDADEQLARSVMDAFRREAPSSIDRARRSWSLRARGRWILAAAALLLIAFGVAERWSPAPAPPSTPGGFVETPRPLPAVNMAITLDFVENQLDEGPDGLPRVRQDHQTHTIEWPPVLEPERPSPPVETRERSLRYLQFTNWTHH